MTRYEKPYLVKIEATSKVRGDRRFNDSRSVYKDLRAAVKMAERLATNNGDAEYWIHHHIWIIDRNADEGECIVFDWKREEAV